MNFGWCHHLDAQWSLCYPIAKQYLINKKNFWSLRGGGGEVNSKNKTLRKLLKTIIFKTGWGLWVFNTPLEYSVLIRWSGGRGISFLKTYKILFLVPSFHYSSSGILALTEHSKSGHHRFQLKQIKLIFLKIKINSVRSGDLNFFS